MKPTKQQPKISTSEVSERVARSHAADADQYVSLQVVQAHEEFEVTYGHCDVADPRRRGELRISAYLMVDEVPSRFSIDGGWVVLDGVTPVLLREIAHALTSAATRMDQLCDTLAPVIRTPESAPKLRRA